MAEERRRGILLCCQALAALGYFDRMPIRRLTVSRREYDDDQQRPGRLALANTLLVVPAKHARLANEMLLCDYLLQQGSEQSERLMVRHDWLTSVAAWVRSKLETTYWYTLCMACMTQLPILVQPHAENSPAFCQCHVNNKL